MQTVGDGKGLAVLLHAAGARPRALETLSHHLGTVLGRTLTPPMPGTVAKPPNAPLRRQVEVAQQALASAEQGPRILFGHSFGGLVSLLTLLDGAQVEAAILFEPIVMACLDLKDPVDVAARDADRSIIDYLAERHEASDSEPGVARFVEAYNEVSWDSLPEGPRQAMVSDARNMMELTQCVHHHPIDLEKVRDLEVPILVMHGDRSPEGVQLVAQRLSALLPDSDLVTVAGAGHMGPHLMPDLVFEALSPFLRSRIS